MIGKIIPELEGKPDGIAVRTPVKSGSLLDLTCMLAADASSERINDAFRQRAATASSRCWPGMTTSGRFPGAAWI